jgi:hypothetical protein
MSSPILATQTFIPDGHCDHGKTMVHHGHNVNDDDPLEDLSSDEGRNHLIITLHGRPETSKETFNSLIESLNLEGIRNRLSNTQVYNFYLRLLGQEPEGDTATPNAFDQNLFAVFLKEHRITREQLDKLLGENEFYKENSALILFEPTELIRVEPYKSPLASSLPKSKTPLYTSVASVIAVFLAFLGSQVNSDGDPSKINSAQVTVNEIHRPPVMTVAPLDPKINTFGQITNYYSQKSPDGSLWSNFYNFIQQDPHLQNSFDRESPIRFIDFKNPPQDLLFPINGLQRPLNEVCQLIQNEKVFPFAIHARSVDGTVCLNSNFFTRPVYPTSTLPEVLGPGFGDSNAKDEFYRNILLTEEIPKGKFTQKNYLSARKQQQKQQKQQEPRVAGATNVTPISTKKSLKKDN